MSAFETCWAEASRRALTQGGSVVDHYQDLIAQYPNGHQPTPPKEHDHV